MVNSNREIFVLFSDAIPIKIHVSPHSPVRRGVAYGRASLFRVKFKKEESRLTTFAKRMHIIPENVGRGLLWTSISSPEILSDRLSRCVRRLICHSRS